MQGKRKLIVAVGALVLLGALAVLHADPAWQWGVVAVGVGWQAPRTLGVLLQRKPPEGSP